MTVNLSISLLSRHPNVCVSIKIHTQIILSIFAQYKLETKLDCKYSAIKSVTLSLPSTILITYTHNHSLKFLFLANSQHTLGVAHHPGNTLAQAKLLGHVSLHTKSRQITVNSNTITDIYSPTTRTERSQPIWRYVISTSFRFRTFRKPQLLI